MKTIGIARAEFAELVAWDRNGYAAAIAQTLADIRARVVWHETVRLAQPATRLAVRSRDSRAAAVAGLAVVTMMTAPTTDRQQ